MNTPLEQFVIRPVINIRTEWLDLTITNSTIFIIITVLLILTIFNISTKSNKDNRYKYIIEGMYSKVEELIRDMIPGEYRRYIPLIISIFIFILTSNTIGLVPYTFTTTSHFALTLTMSISIMIGVTIIGVMKHKLNFINLFLPQGLNQGMMKLIIPLVFSIEVVSYLIRVISLSVRLSANLISGHTLLKILANFGLKYTISIPLLMVLPIGLLSAIYILEIGVAIIQAYVFTLLTTTYIKDTELLH